MAALIERVIYDQLQLGLDSVFTSQTGLRSFSANLGLESAEHEGLIENLLQNRPEVRHGYARERQRFPSANIILSSEREKVAFLGGVGADPGGGGECYSSLWDRSYVVQVTTTHPDITLWLYAVLKYILRSRIRHLEAASNAGSIYMSGEDISPLQDYLPAHLFQRVLTLHFDEVPEEVLSAPNPDVLITRVDGLYGPTETTGAIGSVEITDGSS